jgi:hypothetical protein
VDEARREFGIASEHDAAGREAGIPHYEQHTRELA